MSPVEFDMYLFLLYVVCIRVGSASLVRLSLFIFIENTLKNVRNQKGTK